MRKILETFTNALRMPSLRKKIIFTVVAMLIYRLGCLVPVPGVNTVAFTKLIESYGQLGTFLDIISGGAFKQVSIFALGIQPYINSSIIMQLLTVAIPALERLSREGEVGQKKIQRITRYVTIGLAFVLSFFYWNATRLAHASVLPVWLNAFVVILSFTAGSAFIMWLGEQVNARGIGNGISLIIGVGIVSRLPHSLPALYAAFKNWQFTSNVVFSLVGVLLVLLVFVAIITLVVYVHHAERRIPVQYAKRVVGRKMFGGQSTYLPVKINQSGVLPIIFAVSVIMLPSTIVTMTGASGPIANFFKTFNSNPLYYFVHALLIVAFTFFYSMITFNAVDIATNLQKNGGYIPGFRPGKPTIEFLGRTSRRLNWFDALFLVVIVLAPTLFSLATNVQGVWFGGTAVLIVVGVAIELVTQIESQLTQRQQKGFLD